MKITPKQYALLLLDLEKEGLDEAVMEKRLGNFVEVLRRNKDISKVSKIERIYSSLKKEEKGLLDAQVTSAKELSEDQLEEIKKKLSAKYDVDEKKISIQKIIDEKLRGGFIVRVENEIIDASVKAKINQLKKAFV